MKKLLSVILAVAMFASMFSLQLISASAFDENDSPKSADETFTINTVKYTSQRSILNGSYYTGLVNEGSTDQEDYKLQTEFTIKASQAATSGQLIIPLDYVYDVSKSYSSSSAPYLKNFTYKVGTGNVTNAVILNGPVANISGTKKYISIPLSSEASSETNLNIYLYSYFEFKHITMVPNDVTLFDGFYTLVNGTQNSAKQKTFKTANYGFFSSKTSRVGPMDTNEFIKQDVIYKGERKPGQPYDSQPFYVTFSPTLFYNSSNVTQIIMNKQRVSAGLPIVEVVMKIPAGVIVTVPSTSKNISLSGSLSTGYTVTSEYTKIEDIRGANVGTVINPANLSIWQRRTDAVQLFVPSDYPSDKMNVESSVKAYTQECADKSVNYEEASCTKAFTILDPVQDFNDKLSAVGVTNKESLSLSDSSGTVVAEYADVNLQNQGILPIEGAKYTWENDDNLPACAKDFRNYFIYPAKVLVTIKNNTSTRTQAIDSVPKNGKVTIGSGAASSTNVHIDSGEWVDKIESQPFYVEDGVTHYGIKGTDKYFNGASCQCPIYISFGLPANGRNLATNALIQDGEKSVFNMTFEYEPNYTVNGVNKVDIFKEYDSSTGTYSENATGKFTRQVRLYYVDERPSYAALIKYTDNSVQEAIAGTATQPTQFNTTLYLRNAYYDENYGIIKKGKNGFLWNQPIITAVFPIGVGLDTSRLTKSGNKYITTGTNVYSVTTTAERLTDSDGCQVWRFTLPESTSFERNDGKYSFSARSSINTNLPLLIGASALGGEQEFKLYASSPTANDFMVAKPEVYYYSSESFPKNTVSSTGIVTDVNDYDGDGSRSDSVGEIVISKAFRVNASYEINCASQYKNSNNNFVSASTEPIAVKIGGDNDFRSIITNDGNSIVSKISITNAFPNFGNGAATYKNGSLIIEILDKNNNVSKVITDAVISGTTKLDIALGSVELYPGYSIRLTGTFTVRSDARPNFTADSTTTVSSTFAGSSKLSVFNQSYRTQIAMANANVKVFFDMNGNGTYEAGTDKAVDKATIITQITTTGDVTPFRDSSSISGTVEKNYSNLNYGEYFVNVSNIKDENGTEVSQNKIVNFEITLEQALAGSTVEVLVPLTPYSFPVKYVGNGGKTEDNQTTLSERHVYKEVVSVKSGSIFERIGYTFAGWSASPSVATTGSFSMPAADVTFTAQWVVNKYDLTIVPNGGTWGGTANDQKFTQNYNSTKNVPDPTRVGFNFTGWTLTGEGAFNTANKIYTYGIGNGVLTAQWSINSYSLTVVPNGGTWDDKTTNSVLTQEFNTTCVVADPERLGYTFTGWTLSPTGSNFNESTKTFTFINTNCTLTAQWQINSYTLTYDGNGATKDGSTTVSDGNHDFDSTVTVKDTMFEREGYTFTGWNTQADGNGTAYAVAETFTMPASAVTLYAQWTANKYKVSYNGNGTEIDGDATVFDAEYDYATDVKVKDNMFEREGYTFTGWNTQADGLGTDYAVDATFTMPAGDVVLYAQWTVNEYTLSYSANTGSADDKIESDGKHGFGSEVAVKELMFTNTGYNFVGWNTAADGSGDTYMPEDMFRMPASDTVLYAQWSVNGYNFVYNGNGGSTSDSKATFTDGIKNFGTTVTVKDNMFTREGYTFSGWNTVADGTGVAYKANDTMTMPANNVVLYAQWTSNDYEMFYNGNGATKDNSATVSDGKHKFDSEVTIKDNMFSRDGYTFAGWNTKADGTGTAYKANDKFKMPARDVTLYAQWTVNSLKVIYNGNGGTSDKNATVSGGNAEFDSTVTVKDNMFTYSGYTFTGWNTAADGTGTAYKTNDTFKMPSSDVTLYAQWDATMFNVTYHSNGGTNVDGFESVDQAHEFASMVTVEQSMYSRVGYSFIGWNTIADGVGKAFAVGDKFEMPAQNVDLYAQWKINAFNIVYNGNGGFDADGKDVVTNGPIDWNTVLNLNEGIFERDGYIFIGWNTAPDGSGTSYAPNAQITLENGLVLYAVWQKKEAPKTGDITATNAIMAILVFAAAVAAAILFYKKRNGYAE